MSVDVVTRGSEDGVELEVLRQTGDQHEPEIDHRSEGDENQDDARHPAPWIVAVGDQTEGVVPEDGIVPRPARIERAPPWPVDLLEDLGTHHGRCDGPLAFDALWGPSSLHRAQSCDLRARLTEEFRIVDADALSHGIHPPRWWRERPPSVHRGPADRGHRSA